MISASWRNRFVDPRIYQRDRFHGALHRTFEATGYFRLEKRDRWWFVTPDGHPFLSLGLNHIEPDPLLWPYNRRYWTERFATEATETNARFLEAFERKVRLDMAMLGMNTLGCHSPTHYYRTWRIPYIQTVRFVDICHWQTPTESDFRDVFAPTFEAHCEQLAREQVAPRAQDPYLIGYSTTDCPVFTDLDAAPRGSMVYGAPRQALPTWPNVLRNLDGDAPGKQAYVTLMRELYHEDLNAFNSTYDTRFQSWGELLHRQHWRGGIDPQNERELADNAAFLERVVERYYQVMLNAIRRYAPHQLFFGDKLNGNTGVPDNLIAIIAKYVDVLFFQFYAPYEDQEPILDRWSELSGRPLFNGDSCFSVPHAREREPLGVHCNTQEERARQFTEYAERAFSRPDFVGWNWCGWMDKWDGYGRDSRHSGLQDPFGRLYQPMQHAMADFAARMYLVAERKSFDQSAG